MGKRKLSVGTHKEIKCDHAQCRLRVCIICFQAKGTEKSALRNILDAPHYVSILKENVGENFDANDERQPLGLCDKCRKKHFGKKSPATFELPEPYVYTVVLKK